MRIVYIMKYTKDSLQIQSFIKKFDKIASENLTKTRLDIIKSFFVKLNSFHYDKLHCTSQLSVSHNHSQDKSGLFNEIPYKIRIDIEENYNTSHTITYVIHSKIVKYHIYDKTELNRMIIENMVHKMNMWLSIAYEQADNKCSNTLDVHIF